MKDFLPISIEEIKKRGWEQLDFLFVSGDAYVDHPSLALPLFAVYLKRRGTRWLFCASQTGANRKTLLF